MNATQFIAECARLASAGVCFDSKPLRDAGLLQNRIGHDARGHRDRHRKGALADRAAPHLVAALALAHKLAAMRQQQRPQLRVKAAAHGLQGHSPVHGLVLKQQAQMGLGNVQPVLHGHLGGDQPDPFDQRFIGGRLGGHVQVITGRHPHAALAIVRDGERESRPGRLEGKDVGHAGDGTPAGFLCCRPKSQHKVAIL